MSRRHRPAVGGSALLLALALLFGMSGAFPTHRTAYADDDERSRVLYLLLVDTSVSMRDKPEGRDEPKMATVRKVLGEFMKSLPSEPHIRQRPGRRSSPVKTEGRRRSRRGYRGSAESE